MIHVRVALLSILALQVVFGSPNGAPGSACDTMIPGHGVSAQTSTPSYTITPSPLSYRCGESVTVTMSGGNFRGFLCQARTNVDTYSTTVGTLAQSGSYSMNQNCGAGNALTHSENGDKSEIEFTWEPSEDHGSVFIVCSIVQTKTMFWVKLASAELTYGGNCTSTGTTQSSTSSNNAGGSTTPSSGENLRVSAGMMFVMTLASLVL